MQDFHPKEYFVDWKRGTSGKIVKGSNRDLNHFVIQIIKLVEAREMTGYYYRVKQEIDGDER